MANSRNLTRICQGFFDYLVVVFANPVTETTRNVDSGQGIAANSASAVLNIEVNVRRPGGIVHLVEMHGALVGQNGPLLADYR